MKKIAGRILRILAWTTGSIVALLVLVLLLIRLPTVQDFLRKKIVAYLEHKIGTRVVIRHIDLDLPNRVVLEGFYFEDQKKDTLLAGERLAVDISVFKLLKNQVQLNSLELQGIRANIYRRQPDTAFNFDYIVQAFVTAPKESKPKDTSAPMTFRIGKVHLSKIRATFQDDVTGNDVYCYLGDFQTRIKTFDPGNMSFDIRRVAISDLMARVYQHQPLARPRPEAQREAESNEPINLKLDFGTLDLQRIFVDYRNDVSALSTSVNMGRLLAEADSIDLGSLYVHLNNLELHHTDARLSLGRTPQARVVEEETEETAIAQANNPWHFLLDKVSFSNNRLKFDNDNTPAVPKGMDYAHLDASGLSLEARRLSFTPAVFEGDVQHMALSEKSGLNLKELRTVFRYDERQAFLRNLYLQTDQTLLRDRLAIAYPSIDSIARNIGVLYIDADLTNSSIATKDILIFAPMLASMAPFNRAPSAVYRLDAGIRGPVRDLQISRLKLNGLGRTTVQLNGAIKGLPDAERTYYRMRIAQLSTSARDLDLILPPNTLPPDIRVPETIDVQGLFAGRVQEFNTTLDVRSSRGQLQTTAYMKNNGAAYAARIRASELDLGYITRQEQNVGRVSMAAEAKGSGFDPQTAVADFRMQVFSAAAKGYTYRNLSLSGKAAKGHVTLEGRMRDPHLVFDLKGNASFKSRFPAVQADLMLDSADFQALKLSAEPLRMHSRVVADFSNTDPDRLNGVLHVTDLIVATASQRVVTDTLTLTALSADSGNRITLSSEAIAADLSGRYKLTELGTALQNTIHRYYPLQGYHPASVAPQEWTLRATVVPSPLLLALAPQIRGTDTLKALMDFSAEGLGSSLSLRAQSPKVMFGSTSLDSLHLSAQTADSGLAYALALQGAGNPSFHVYGTELSGRVDSSTIGFTLRVEDRQETEQYALGGTLHQLPGDGLQLALRPGSVRLDYEPWAVPGDNYIRYASTGIVAHNFALSHGDQLLRLHSQSAQASAPLDVQFRNFSIGTITGIAGQDSLFVEGLINGDATVLNPTGNPVFTSDIRIQSLSYYRDTIGDVLVKVNNQTPSVLAAHVQVEGKGNDVQLTGEYGMNDERMNLLLAINRFNFSQVRSFSGGQIQDAGGSLNGRVTIEGTLQQPQLNGYLRFDSAHVVSTLLGERYRLPQEKILVNSQGLHFDHFTLVDSNGNKAVIDGDLLTSDFRNYRFALDLDADNFQAVNVRRRRGEQTFYGSLNLSSHIRLQGDMNSPKATGNLRINKGTDFKIMLPSSDPEVESRIGVVRFVDKSNPALSGMLVVKDSVKKSPLKGIDVSANIETDSNAKFTMIIDERNGDALTLRGVANLSGGIDPSGKTTLTGSYRLQQGSYLLTLNFLKRQFNIEPGSTITWTGEPTSALVDITAVYIANTASLDLVEHQLAGRSQAEINRFKQKLPFQVLLKMNGELLKPIITFDIRLTDEDASQWKDVAAKLDQVRQDQSELNKQVFALLLLNRFVDENPLQNSAGSNTAESYLRQSASRILTDQLNQLAGNLIKGVDVNFGLTSGDDYTSGNLEQRTDLNVNVSKRLLNDRLRVSVGSNFELEGPAQNNQDASQIASDVSIDYQLTRDGRYTIRGYRKNQYQDIVVGQVVENGLTFVFTLDYDNFREFFAKPKPAGNQQKKNNDKKATSK